MHSTYSMEFSIKFLNHLTFKSETKINVLQRFYRLENNILGIEADRYVQMRYV